MKKKWNSLKVKNGKSFLINRIVILGILLFSLSGLTNKPSKILILGDSISIGYFPYVKEALKDHAIVVHNKGNAQHSRNGLEKIREWLGDEKWDIIQFNWGLWDLCYRLPAKERAGNRDKVNGKITCTLEEYRNNLDAIVKILEGTGAKLIFVTTTIVPEGEPGRIPEDVAKYNAIAKELMQAHGIVINDLNRTSKKVHKKYARADNDVHYNNIGYQKLSEAIIKVLEKQLD